MGKCYTISEMQTETQCMHKDTFKHTLYNIEQYVQRHACTPDLNRLNKYTDTRKEKIHSPKLRLKLRKSQQIHADFQ